MSELVPLVYYGGLTVLFFFWIYGIVSFALDLKHKLVPGIRQYRRGRTQRDQRHQDDHERKENEEQLY
ncbi:hypothetical protein [Natronorubrum tibetense]|uniref:Uncharacterized protein n=1 Tax=Natronorubrum tibetense GA33 TaxID=1114856 RepID=L9VTU1_9EURY|nr:hypothetical protein [Natronorubrum tibetense]ELY39683.1 hypothetical protein C496_13436 [Natronorubrum tibetense GA33]